MSVKHPVTLAMLGSALLLACAGEPAGNTGPQFIATTLEAVTPASLAGTAGTLVVPGLTVRAKDRTGRPVPGVEVQFVVIAGGGTLQGAVSRTGSDGTATMAWTLGQKTGLNQVIARSGGLPSVAFTATAGAGPAAHIWPRNSSARLETAGSPAKDPLSVLVDDQFNNPVPGVTVTFSVISGGGTIAAAVTNTNAQGIATSGQWTLGAEQRNVAGASVPGLATAQFILTALIPGGLAGRTYELESIRVGSLPHYRLPSRIVFGLNGEFTSYVETALTGNRVTVSGHGHYWSSTSEILLMYSNEFFATLGQALYFWPQYGAPDEDTGAILGDALTLYRCWTEDCYNSVWTYRRVP